MHPESRNTPLSPRKPVECSFRLDCFGFSCAKLYMRRAPEMAERWTGRENHLSMSGNVLHAREKLCVSWRVGPLLEGVCASVESYPKLVTLFHKWFWKLCTRINAFVFCKTENFEKAFYQYIIQGKTASLLRGGGVLRKLLLCSTSKEFNGVIKMKGDKDNCLKLIGLCFW